MIIAMEHLWNVKNSNTPEKTILRHETQIEDISGFNCEEKYDDFSEQCTEIAVQNRNLAPGVTALIV